MYTLDGIALLANLALSLALGLRLLWLGARREWVVAPLGLYVLASACLATPPQLVVYGSLVDPLLRLAPDTERALLAAAEAALALGAAGAYVFTWRRFRPDARWARRLVFAGCGAMATSWIVEADGAGFAPAVLPGPAHWLGWVARSGALAWTLFESLRWHAALRRRVQIGLVAPLTAHQLWLWALGALLACLGLALDPLARLAIAPLAGPLEAGLDGAAATATGVAFAASMALGAASAGALWIAFFPPRAYRRWIAARSASAA